LFSLSLAQWSINRRIFDGDLELTLILLAQLPTLGGLALWLALGLWLAIRGFRWKVVAA
jgi:hypothetical protein